MPLRDRIPPVWAIVTFAVVLTFCLTLAVINTRWPLFGYPGAQQCRAAYRRAKTAEDTLMIDDAHMSSSRGHPDDPPCGYWRKSGTLK
jgi:hypothetical protein